jgi:hypothetical protein
MPVELSQLMQLVAGQRQSLQVGDLPRVVAERLECHPAVVYLGHREVIKIVRLHGSTIKVEELQSLPYMVRDAEYRVDPMRRVCASLYFHDQEKACLYVIGLKPACRGGEIWISTFYRSSVEKQVSQRSRGELVRRQLRKR